MIQPVSNSLSSISSQASSHTLSTNKETETPEQNIKWDTKGFNHKIKKSF